MIEDQNDQANIGDQVQLINARKGCVGRGFGLSYIGRKLFFLAGVADGDRISEHAEWSLSCMRM